MHQVLFWNTYMYIFMAGLGRTQGPRFNNLKYADDTVLMAESRNDLKWPFGKVKEENYKAHLQLTIKKKKIMTTGLYNFSVDNEEM